MKGAQGDGLILMDSLLNALISYLKIVRSIKLLQKVKNVLCMRNASPLQKFYKLILLQEVGQIFLKPRSWKKFWEMGRFLLNLKLIGLSNFIKVEFFLKKGLQIIKNYNWVLLKFASQIKTSIRILMKRIWAHKEFHG